MFRDQEEALRELEQQLLAEDTQPAQETCPEEYSEPVVPQAEPVIYDYREPAYEEPAYEAPAYDEPEEKDRSNLVALLVVLLTLGLLTMGGLLLYMGGYL